ncbi:hypothetical protein JTB14_037678 [Gonioctena quinquepunctata]|nr:hypothetical protein JTB14_037678 [Gonioctena quinquepunctata]
MLDNQNHQGPDKSQELSNHPMGYDNPNFEHTRSRRNSSSHAEGPVRKKSQTYKLNELDHLTSAIKSAEHDTTRHSIDTHHLSRASSISRRTQDDQDIDSSPVPRWENQCKKPGQFKAFNNYRIDYELVQDCRQDPNYFVAANNVDLVIKIQRAPS